MKSANITLSGWIRSMVTGVLLLLIIPVYGQSPGLNEDGIAQAMGKKGEVSGEVYKVSFPRSDLKVKVNNVLIRPALALTSWAAFKKSGDLVITYGDLVLLENELNPVISILEERGIEIAAIHNHLIHEKPRVFYIHFTGYGNEVELAKGLHEALEKTKTPLQSKTSGMVETKNTLDEQIEKIIGYKGKVSGDVLHINVPRNDVHVKMMGTEIPDKMGMNTSLNFQLEGKKAAVNGDFMLLPGEVNPVIKVLRTNGIEIASLHNHMLDEEPRIYFMHYWAYDDAIHLSMGLRTALNQIAK